MTAHRWLIAAAAHAAFRRLALRGPLRLSLVARPPPTSCAWSCPPARSCATSNCSAARPPARPPSPPARLTLSFHLARGRQSERTTTGTSLSVTPPTMHSPFVLAEKTLGAPNFASCGHQTGALPPISALPIYPPTLPLPGTRRCDSRARSPHPSPADQARPDENPPGRSWPSHRRPPCRLTAAQKVADPPVACRPSPSRCRRERTTCASLRG